MKLEFVPDAMASTFVIGGSRARFITKRHRSVTILP